MRPAMLESSVQAVVVCNATAPRVCTLVLFNIREFTWRWCGKKYSADTGEEGKMNLAPRHQASVRLADLPPATGST